MVLGPQGPGRVGRRRFLLDMRAAHRAARSRSPIMTRSATRWSRRAHETAAALLAATPTVPAGADVTAPAGPRGRDRYESVRGADLAGDSPAALRPCLFAALLDADDLPRPARPGRPPSRPRSRPRAAGTSGRGQAHRACVAGPPMFVVGRTCVRKIGGLSDDNDTNVCACRSIRANLALCLGFRHGVRAMEIAWHEVWLRSGRSPRRQCRVQDA
jgi:hypothetical protein